jgi:hypothetical protein
MRDRAGVRIFELSEKLFFPGWTLSHFADMVFFNRRDCRFDTYDLKQFPHIGH